MKQIFLTLLKVTVGSNQVLQLPTFPYLGLPGPAPHLEWTCPANKNHHESGHNSVWALRHISPSA